MAREKLTNTLRKKGCLCSEDVVQEWAEVLHDRGGAQTEDQAVAILGDALRLADAEGVVVKRPRDCGSYIGIVRARRESQAQESEKQQVVQEVVQSKRERECVEMARTQAMWRSPEQLAQAREVLSRGIFGLWGKLLDTQVKKGFATGLVLKKADEESTADLKEAV